MHLLHRNESVSALTCVTVGAVVDLTGSFPLGVRDRWSFHFADDALDKYGNKGFSVGNQI